MLTHRLYIRGKSKHNVSFTKIIVLKLYLKLRLSNFRITGLNKLI